MKAVLITLGCKINQCESEGLARLLQERGYEVSYGTEIADLFVVNTCAVTNEAEHKSRQAVRRLARRAPDSKILVTGCSAQRSSDVFAELPNVVTVGGTYDKYRWIRDYLDGIEEDFFGFGVEYVDDPEQIRVKTREYVKVQDGCDRFCSYCIIPYLRGRSRSRSLSAIHAQVRASTAKEIVLTGIDLSDYGKRDGLNLAKLLSGIDHPRIRLGSLEPQVIDEDFLDVMSDDRFCKHFHISMQSGSDRVLKSMNRRYTAQEFLDKVALIRSRFPTANITTDCIAGFPTETLEEHAETLATIEIARFGDMHVFPYSEREGTRAAKMKQVPKQERERRAREIIAVSERLRAEYAESRLGTVDTVLTETLADGVVTGRTKTYLEARLPADTPTDTLVEVMLTERMRDGSVVCKRTD